MAETKKKKIVSASTGKEVSGARKKATVKKQAAPVGNATVLRVGAILLWLVALAFEVIAVLIFNETIKLTFMPQIAQIIIALVLDLICVIIGSQLWKKANHIKPASKKNPFLFWLWNNMGVIVSTLAFVPFVILALTNKEADKKTKTIATAVAAVALLIAGLSSYEWNPISEEEQQAAMTEIEGDVFWAPSGKVYHMDEDCQAFTQSEELIVGSVEEAIAAGRTRLCSFCAKRHDVNTEGMLTDDVEVDDAELEDETEEVEDETVDEATEE